MAGGEAEAARVADVVVGGEAAPASQGIKYLLLGRVRVVGEGVFQQEVGAHGAEEVFVREESSADWPHTVAVGVGVGVADGEYFLSGVQQFIPVSQRFGEGGRDETVGGEGGPHRHRFTS